MNTMVDALCVKKGSALKGNMMVQVRSHAKSPSHISTFKTVKSPQQLDIRCIWSSTLPISSIRSPGNTSSGSS